VEEEEEAAAEEEEEAEAEIHETPCTGKLI